MAIIITGGSGFLGRILSRQFVASGEKVFALSRTPGRVSPIGGVEEIGWDGRTSAGWQELVEGDTVIINLAGDNIGSGLWTAEKKRRIASSRISAGFAVTEAVQKAKVPPRLVIQASGVGYYGIRSDSPRDESANAGADWLAKLSVSWEESTRAVENLGVRRVIIRLGVVLHPSTGILPRYMIPFKLFIGGPLGSGKQWVSWIHPCDFVGAVDFFIHAEQANGAFNLSAPGVERYEVFGRALGKIMGRPYWIPAPAFALRLALGEMSTLVLDGQHAIPKRLIDMGFQFRFPNIHSALADLFEPNRVDR
jgi:hypothetical protein